MVATAQDKDFLNNLLGEFDTSLPATESRSLKKRKEEPARKTRKLSPPRKAGVKRNGMMPSSPPMIKDEDDDEPAFLPQPPLDEDVNMSDAPMPPSSPTLNAVKRKQPSPDDDDDDDDVFAVAEVKGNRNVKVEKVNISSARPIKSLPSAGITSSPAKAEDIDSSDWTSVGSSLNIMKDSGAPAIGKLQPEHAVEEDGSVKMFWMDYTEVNGALVLFGKVQDKRSGKYVSAFLKVDGILRNLYFLPRETRVKNGQETNENVEMTEVHKEVEKVFELSKISEFKAKSSTRKYAFELPDIPKESDYLKVLYPFTKPPLMEHFHQGETYSHVFGVGTALFEQFVLCRDIMGPCWIRLEGVDFKACANVGPMPRDLTIIH